MINKTSLNDICQAAIAVFARYGYRRTRVEDVAEALEIAPSTLYRYVKNKRDLYEKCVEFGIGRWQEKVIKALDGLADPVERFLTMCRKGFEHLAHDEDLRAIMIDDPSIFPLAPRKARFPAIDNTSLKLIKSVIRDGIEQGVFREVDLEYTSELLYSIYVMFIIKTYVKSEGHSANGLFEQGLDLILEGLKR